MVFRLKNGLGGSNGMQEGLRRTNRLKKGLDLDSGKHVFI